MARPESFMTRAKKLARSGRISEKQMSKISKPKGIRGSQISVRKPRGGVGKGMAGM